MYRNKYYDRRRRNYLYRFKRYRRKVIKPRFRYRTRYEQVFRHTQRTVKGLIKGIGARVVKNLAQYHDARSYWTSPLYEFMKPTMRVIAEQMLAFSANRDRQSERRLNYVTAALTMFMGESMIAVTRAVMMDLQERAQTEETKEFWKKYDELSDQQTKSFVDGVSNAYLHYVYSDVLPSFLGSLL